MATATDILTEQFAESSTNILSILEGIGDEEFFWEPYAGCWTLHHQSEVRTPRPDGAGAWVLDGEWEPPPVPAPVTTIAWRTAHVAAVNYVYWDHAFGSATLTFDLEFPSNAAEAVEWLAASQRPLLHALGVPR